MASTPQRKRSHLNIDVSKRAESELEVALDEVEIEGGEDGEDDEEDTEAEEEVTQPIKTISIDKSDESTKKPISGIVFNTNTGRTKARVLFITTDETLLEQDSRSAAYYEDLKDQFDEIHILVLRVGRSPAHGPLRVADNVWVYVAAHKYWWWLPVEGMSVVGEELVLTSGFHPDVVVAKDPFECGAMAYWLSQKYKVPIQIHVFENIFANYFKKLRPGNTLRYYVAKFLLNRIRSVRTTTVLIKDELEKRFPNLLDAALWPQYHNYQAIVETKPAFDVHDRFNQYSFIMAYVGGLTYQSTLPKLLDGMVNILRNPRVGLIVIGYGPAKGEIETKVRKLGIERQVIFVSQTSHKISYLKTVNLVVVTDVSPDGDDAVLDAAASGAPILMTRNELREDIFEDDVSAVLCAPGDLPCINEKFTELLDNVGKRQQLGAAAVRAVTSRVHEDHDLFRQAIRNSVEGVFTVEDVYGVDNQL